MVDGATFTLRPNTRLRIDAYVYSDTEASKNKSLLSLIQGALRAVTGAIGTLNRPGYHHHGDCDRGRPRRAVWGAFSRHQRAAVGSDFSRISIALSEGTTNPV